MKNSMVHFMLVNMYFYDIARQVLTS